MSLSTGAADRFVVFVSLKKWQGKKIEGAKFAKLKRQFPAAQHFVGQKNQQFSPKKDSQSKQLFTWKKKVCQKQTHTHTHQHLSHCSLLSLAPYGSYILSMSPTSLVPHTSNHRRPACVDQSQPAGQLWYSLCQPPPPLSRSSNQYQRELPSPRFKVYSSDHSESVSDVRVSVSCKTVKPRQELQMLKRMFTSNNM